MGSLTNLFRTGRCDPVSLVIVRLLKQRTRCVAPPEALRGFSCPGGMLGERLVRHVPRSSQRPEDPAMLLLLGITVVGDVGGRVRDGGESWLPLRGLARPTASRARQRSPIRIAALIWPHACPGHQAAPADAASYACVSRASHRPAPGRHHVIAAAGPHIRTGRFRQDHVAEPVACVARVR
jgi:hypothetical protein